MVVQVCRDYDPPPKLRAQLISTPPSSLRAVRPRLCALHAAGGPVKGKIKLTATAGHCLTLGVKVQHVLLGQFGKISPEHITTRGIAFHQLMLRHME